MITIEGQHREKETRNMTQTMQTVDHAPVAEKEVKIAPIISDHSAISRSKMKVVNLTNININITKIATVVVMGEVGILMITAITTTSVDLTIVVVATIRSTNITITIMAGLATILMTSQLRRGEITHQENVKEVTRSLM